ncbi:hypothetical protein BDV12DRAFT_208211 [Aspergillus spectabilis]
MFGLGPDINPYKNQHPDAGITIYPRISEHDPIYCVEETSLRSAIFIPNEFKFGRDSKTPVILVPGTGTYGGEAFAHSFARLLKNSSFGDPIWLNIPGRMCGDSHLNAEYVAFAIAYISTCAQKPVAVGGWSQGNLATQWTLKYWPSTRSNVDNFISWGLTPIQGTQPGTPAVWHQRRNADFIGTLRSNGGDSAYVPTTSIYSATDERGLGVTNCELQVQAKFRPAGLIYTHETVMYNPLAWALAEDAIKNVSVCMHTKAPGLNMLDATMTQALAPSALKHILLFFPKPWHEPDLSLYASQEEKTYVPDEVVVDAKVAVTVAEAEVPAAKVVA